MNFEFEKTGELTARLTTILEPIDYQQKVEEKLREYRRKASMPGFRPGKVPFGVIKKMYGQSVLADEVFHVASEAVYKYLEDNKTEFILSPLMDDIAARTIEWNEGSNFTFYFDIALNPEIDPVADSNINLTKYEIISSESDVDNYIGDIRERYGRFDKADAIDEKSFFSGQVQQLDAEGNIDAAGLEKFIHLRMKSLPESIRPIFNGHKNEDVLVLDIEKDLPDADLRTEVFNVDIDKARQMSGKYSIKIQSVLTVIPADLDEKVFSEVFPGRNISSEAELREAVESDVLRTYEKEARKQFYFDIQKELKNKYSFELPEEFLKKYIKQRSEKEISQEDIEKGYPFYADELKWQLIENKLIRKYNLAVGQADIRENIQNLIGLGDMDSNDPEVKEKIDQVYGIIVNDKERLNNLVDNMTDERIIDLFEKNGSIEIKQMNWKEFLTLVNEKN